MHKLKLMPMRFLWPPSLKHLVRVTGTYISCELPMCKELLSFYFVVVGETGGKL